MKGTVLLLVLVNGFLAANVGSAGESALLGESPCLCAIFKDGDTQQTIEPLVSSNANETFGVNCAGNGERDCQESCVTLARAAKIKGEVSLCEVVHTDVVGFKPALYYKACNHTDQWQHTGHRCPHTICCLEGKLIACK